MTNKTNFASIDRRRLLVFGAGVGLTLSVPAKVMASLSLPCPSVADERPLYAAGNAFVQALHRVSRTRKPSDMPHLFWTGDAFMRIPAQTTEEMLYKYASMEDFIQDTPTALLDQWPTRADHWTADLDRDARQTGADINCWWRAGAPTCYPQINGRDVQRWEGQWVPRPWDGISKLSL